MNDNDREHIVSILESVADMTIATLREDGFPQATTVSYVSDGLVIWFGTSRRSQKARNIERDGRVSLTVNRPYRFWKDIEGLSVGGRALVVSDSSEYRDVGKLLFDKFPQIHEYAAPESEDIALIRVDPVVISLLDYSKGFGHENVIEL